MFTLLLATGCPRSTDEPVVVPEKADDAVLPEQPAVVDRIARLELGLGLATWTDKGVLEFRGPPEIEQWLAERGSIEGIWQSRGICVRTAEGVACKNSEAEIRIEVPTESEVIDVEWSNMMLCAATADGALWCNYGHDPHRKPLQRYPVSGPRDLEIVGNWGCARLEDGSGLCWLGEREKLDDRGPAPDHVFAAVRDIAVGFQYACILGEDGVPRCHDEGKYDVGALGRDFAAIAGAPPLVEIDGGLRHVCGRTEAGEVWCWGSNEYGQLGDGTTKSDKARAPMRVEGIAKAQQLALANHESCALVEGEVWCWGWLPDTPIDPIPTEIPGIASELEVEQLGACAQFETGWKCWGGETNTPGGVAAVSTIVDATRDEEFNDGCRFGSGRLRCDNGDEVWLDLNGVIDVTRGSDIDPVCALRHERVSCHESYTDDKTVIRVPASVALQGSTYYGCVLTKTGEVHCWSDETPATKIDLPGKQVAVSTIGLDEACALDESGSVRCWTIVQPPITAGVTDIVELHGSQVYGCARDRAGKIACWGHYLVADPHAPRTTLEKPLTIPLPAPAVEFGVGEEYGCARLDDGRVSCWGSEMYGQRGRLSTEFVLRPEPITID